MVAAFTGIRLSVYQQEVIRQELNISINYKQHGQIDTNKSLTKYHRRAGGAWPGSSDLAWVASSPR